MHSYHLNSQSTPGALRRLIRLAIILIFFLCIALVRAYFVSLYSSDIPFWDQWDLLRHTLAPWWNGHMQWASLFAPHNEHRIVWTRLISMGLLALNGGVWSNLVEAYVNTMIYAGVLTAAYLLAANSVRSFSGRSLLALVTLLLGCLPFDWENNLVGFQSQFYLMEGAAILLIGIGAYRPLSRSTWWLLTLCAIGSLFTMAAGLLAPIALVVVVALRALRSPVRPSYLLALTASMTVIAGLGLLLVPTIPGHAVFKAQGISDHVRALLTFLIWPAQPLKGAHIVMLFAVWWPGLFWFINFLRRRETTDAELFSAGMLAWVLLQALAFAHARGHDVTALASRYMDIPALGVICNMALALQMASRPAFARIWRAALITMAALSIALVGIVLQRGYVVDIAAMRQRYQFNLVETYYTQRYLRHHRASDLDHPSLMIPYINGNALAQMLNTASIRELLPDMLHAADTESNDVDSRRRSSERLSHTATDLQNWVRHIAGFNEELPLFEPIAGPDISTGMAPDTHCYLDMLNGTPPGDHRVVAVGAPLQVDGWTVTSKAATNNRLNILLIGGNTYALAFKGAHTRPDVVKALHTSRDDTYGVSVLGILGNVAPGDYALAVLPEGANAVIPCQPPVTISVKH